MERTAKDRMWIGSDVKLLPTDQQTSGRADRFIRDCAEEVSMAM